MGETGDPLEKAIHTTGHPTSDCECETASNPSDSSADEFALIYERYSDRLYRYALFRTRDTTAAQDIVGDTMLAAFEHFDSFDPTRGTLAAWLFTIARSRIVDHYRWSQRVKRLSQKLLSSRTFHEEDPLEAIVRRAGSAHVYAALESLREADREILLLRYAANLTHREIAAQLGVTEGSARVRLHRAIRRLGERMAGGNE